MRSRLKTAAILIVATTGLIGLVGCQAQAGSVSGQGKVALNYYTWFPSEAILTKAIAGFEKANPNITVNLKEFTNTDYQKALPLALSGGEPVDIAGVQIDAMTNTVKDQLLPVSKWKSDLDPGIYSSIDAKALKQTANVASDGKLYSLPLGSIGSAVMFYNATMLKELGMTPPRTAKELQADVAVIKAKKPGILPVATAGKDAWWQEEVLMTLAEQDNPGISSQIISGTGKWNQPAMIAALQTYKGMFDSGILSTDSLSVAYGDHNTQFNDGKAVFLIDATWNNYYLSAAARKAAKNDLADVGAVAIPVMHAGGKPAARALTEGGLAIPTTSKHPAEAAKFISYMFSKAGVNTWGPDLVVIPSVKGFSLPADTLTTPAAVDGLKTITSLVLNATSARHSNQAFNNAVEGNAILDVLSGKKTAKEAADFMQSEWTSGRYPHGKQ